MAGMVSFWLQSFGWRILFRSVVRPETLSSDVNVLRLLKISTMIIICIFILLNILTLMLNTHTKSDFSS